MVSPPSPAYLYRPVDAGHGGFRVAILEPSIEFLRRYVAAYLRLPSSLILIMRQFPMFGAIPTSRHLWRSKALRHIRFPDKKRYIWADALCIDQTNLEERGQQVQQMKEIYSHCTRDLIWLGESNERTERGIQVLMHAQIVIGKHTMEWSVLSAILDHSGIPDRFHGPFGHGTFEQDIWDIFTSVQVIQHQRDSFTRVQPINSTLLDVLSRFQQTYSTDPRDKIFGLLGLATNEHGIVPSYFKSVREVYTDVAYAQIQAEQNLDMIAQSMWPLGAGSDESKDGLSASVTAGLPSCVPNFWLTERETLLFAQRGIFAAGSSIFSEPVTVTPLGKLCIRGTFLGSIKVLRALGSEIVPRNPGESKWVKHWLPESLKDDSVGQSMYPTGEDLFEAYWRTLLADCRMYPAQRLSPQDIEEHSQIFGRWRQFSDVALPDNLFQYTSQVPVTWSERDEEAYKAACELGRINSLNHKMGKWQFAELDAGLYAMVPCPASCRADRTAVQVNDWILVVDGGKVPLVIRQVKSGLEQVDEEWEVLGTAYVHGFMDGRANEWVNEARLERSSITLV
ncbi:uncharacterized protein LY89DRAFT_721896 [Mollisia scopiformis]|uniref:Heterokaryon incompatibility domain-containing protein n=1 Tax=Mollisia scopiformis TaxID=149040 RepID=A0A194WZT0_MOLSC|nr:uncharacterized protein LY89DRAFT_721896 [Mollisia scopiformis]KUJ13127.1 hypothetical protein LY89DRAFT_721896 [Mollisia scopiformis]